MLQAITRSKPINNNHLKKSLDQTVTVKTTNSLFRRPVCKICPLQVQQKKKSTRLNGGGVMAGDMAFGRFGQDGQNVRRSLQTRRRLLCRSSYCRNEIRSFVFPSEWMSKLGSGNHQI